MWQIEINGRVLPQDYETLEIALHKCRMMADGAIVVRQSEPVVRSYKWSPAQRAAAHERALARRTEGRRAEVGDQYWSAVKTAASDGTHHA